MSNSTVCNGIVLTVALVSGLYLFRYFTAQLNIHKGIEVDSQLIQVLHDETLSQVVRNISYFDNESSPSEIPVDI